VARSLVLEDFRFNPPQIPAAQVADAVSEIYGLRGQMTSLPGERDQNFRVESGDTDVVVKIAGVLEDPGVVDLQVSVLQHLARVEPDLPVPRVVLTAEGSPIGVLHSDEGVEHLVRTLTFLPGITFESARSLPRDDVVAIGRTQATMCKALEGLRHPAADHFMPWDISNGLIISDQLWSQAGDDVIAIASGSRDYLAERVVPRMEGLRRQVIHNDCHRGNLLRSDTDRFDVVGIIDFGDLVRAPLVEDLAVSAAGFVGSDDDSEGAVTALAVGFDSVFPLHDEEVEALYGLVLARLVLTALLFDFMIGEQAPHAVNVIPERPEVIVELETWIELDERSFTDRLHRALFRYRMESRRR
jgi:hydroxylysine kinase